MAKTLSHYEGVVQGDPPIYVYEKHDDTSNATRVYKGDLVKLPTWYATEINNSMYRVTYPENGWMFWWNVGNIKPAYVTTTDKCTAPSGVALDAKTKTLTIQGGAGGDLNTFKGYGISWRERDMDGSVWSSWTSDKVTTASTFAVTVNAKKVRQFRVRTRGSAGSSYFSAYVTCPTMLFANNASGAPVIVLPVQNAVSWSEEPLVMLRCPADPDGDELDMQLSIDGGEWNSVSSTTGNEGDECWVYVAGLTEGKHTLTFKLVDTSENESPQASVQITRETFEWSRIINAGDVISNKEISHVHDMREMLEHLNINRRYVGLDDVEYPGTLGKFSDWKMQMEFLLTSINEIRYAFGGDQIIVNAPVYPKASYITFVRDILHGMV